MSTSGALAAEADAGLGAGVDIDSITKNTQAYIATATVTADGNVLVQATSAENLTSVTGAVGISGTVAIAGSAGVYVLGITTRAFIGDDPDNPTSGATTVQASGSILVAASEQTVLNLLSGNFSGSGTASVGAAAGVPVVTKTTEAFIGAGAHVGALGLGNPIEAENGQFDISYAPYSTSVGVAQPKPISANLTGSGNSLTSPRLGQERIATPETQSVQGLAVTAVNSDALQGVGVDGGVSGTRRREPERLGRRADQPHRRVHRLGRCHQREQQRRLSRPVGPGRGRQRRLVPGDRRRARRSRARPASRRASSWW